MWKPIVTAHLLFAVSQMGCGAAPCEDTLTCDVGGDGGQGGSNSSSSSMKGSGGGAAVPEARKTKECAVTAW